MTGLTRRQWLAAATLPPAVRGAHPRYRVGITTNTRGGWEKDVFLSFREAREVGYRYVESFFHYFVGYVDRPGDLQREIETIGVNFVTISNSGPMEMHFEDPARHDTILDEHVRLARFVRYFGCTHLKINLGPRRPEGTTDEDLRHMTTVLEELGRRTRALGVQLAVHAHMWSQFENRREIDFVLSRTTPEHVWFVLDTGHITLAGIDPVALARELGHRIVEFHLKDTAPEHRGGAKRRLERPDLMKDPPFFPLGHGGVDFPALKAHLDSISWRGWLTVELDSSPFRPPKESARMSREYLEQTLGIPVA
ncbi:MAG: sugar phosphate isomerase/epimerase [Bryobacterales bacterium]|nr:sugar phosphate isomerase/epimerase [Bryobacteraceae bacterium]MDW8355618.1 sugar phosphate isomerase/epimerase [Bryobacterales bacterium]